MKHSDRVERSAALPHGVQGAADPHFTCAVRAFSTMFPGPKYGGGALSVYLDGEPVVDVWTGWSDRAGTTHWSADTGAMVFSATKGMASTVIHRLADRGLIDYDAPVAEYWHEFGANGKATITVREVMRHRAGLSQLNGASMADLMDHLKMEERLAAAPVNQVLYGKGAYHALTYGWLMSGLARSVTGKGMRQLIRDELAEPLGIDGLHLGRPPVDAPTKAAQIIIPQGAVKNAVLGCHRAEARRIAVVRRPRRAVLPGDVLGRAGRHPVPRRRDTRRQRHGHRAWSGEDVRAAGMWRKGRRQAVPFAGADRGPDR